MAEGASRERQQRGTNPDAGLAVIAALGSMWSDVEYLSEVEDAMPSACHCIDADRP